MSQSTGLRPRARKVRAAALPFTPAPITATVSASGRAERLGGQHRRRAGASAVNAEPSSTATGIPVSASETSTIAFTVGSPRSRLTGKEVTHLSTACPAPIAGMARKSPFG